MTTTAKGPFWVVGGAYADTSFTKLAEGEKLEVYGPFDDYETALKEWRGHTFRTIDSAQQRYRIVTGEDQAKAA